jgi:polar amino acid transport system substrate-binding protein
MKKLLSILAIGIMTLVLLVGCGNKEELTLKQVKENGKIVIGLDDAYPPMEFRNEKNELVGFDIDLANEIAKKLGVKAEFVTTEWNGILLALQSKKFDMIIAGLSITDERKKTIGFSEPYVMGGQVIAVKTGNNEIKTLADLKGKIVATQMGSTGQEAAEANLKEIKELKKYGKITEAFSELTIGRVDAVIMDAQVGGYYIAKKPGEFVVLDEMVSKEPMGIGFRQEDNELKTEIQKVIEGLKADGTLSKLSVQWFGYDAYKK